MGSEGGHFENVLSGSSNSENMMQKVYVHNFNVLQGGEEYLKTIKKKED
jgi:hypothetical protein